MADLKSGQPISAHALWQTDVQITIVPLDATNKVPVSRDFLQKLASLRHIPLIDLVGQCYANTAGIIPSDQYTYYMWDTLTTGFLGAPQLMSVKEFTTSVIPEGPSSGRIQIEKSGRPIKAVMDVKVDAFLDYFFELLTT